MRKILLLLAVLIGTGLDLFASAAGEARLRKMIPADATAAAFLNYDEWKDAPAVRALKGRNGGSLNDLDAMAAWYRDTDGLCAIMAVMKKPLDLAQIQRMIELSAASHDIADGFKLKLTPEKFRKYPAWSAVAQGPQAIAKPFSFFMVYLPENVLLFAESARTAEKVLDAASRSKGFQVPRELKGTLRAVCRMSTPIAGIPSQMSGSLALTGIKKDNLRGFFKAVCASADDAAQLLMQANMLINFAVSSWFQNDYQLGSRLVSALHFAADKEIVTLKFDLSQELLEKITAYSEKQAKEVVEQKKREKALPARGMNAN